MGNEYRFSAQFVAIMLTIKPRPRPATDTSPLASSTGSDNSQSCAGLADLPRMVAEHEVHAPTLVIVGEGAQSQV
ncbi:hypothetical protein CXQ82_18895 [Pseudomonas sp. S09G 359]|nr:hypothetical protein CXQ82_18895 [Pseudomonas sp. S09G 359]